MHTHKRKHVTLKMSPSYAPDTLGIIMMLIVGEIFHQAVQEEVEYYTTVKLQYQDLGQWSTLTCVSESVSFSMVITVLSCADHPHMPHDKLEIIQPKKN